MNETAKVLMQDVVSVPPSTTVSQAARLMKKSNIGSVMVGDRSRPDGIFTERDIARRVVAEGLSPAKTKVADVMTKKLVTVDAAEPLSRVFECLARGEFRHLPVTENGVVVGIVSLSDLTRMLSELAREDGFLRSFAGDFKP